MCPNRISRYFCRTGVVPIALLSLTHGRALTSDDLSHRAGVASIRKGAFRYAHEADPKAELYYNDYNLEYKAKRKSEVILVKKLKEKGVTVTAIGTQNHHKLDRPTVQQIDDTLTAFKEPGVKGVAYARFNGGQKLCAFIG